MQNMLLPLMLLAPSVLGTIGNIFNPGSQSSQAGMNPLLLMMMMGGKGASMNSLLPFMLMSGTSGSITGNSMTDVMIMSQMSKSSGRRYYRRRRYNSASRMAYMAGQLAVLRARA